MDIWRWHLSRPQLIIGAVALVAVISGLVAVSHQFNSSSRFSLTSPSFKNGGQLAKSATCAGTDINPAFEFKNMPAKTQSLAIYAEDTSFPTSDAQKPNSNLWLVFNIPATTTKITEGIRPAGTITRDYKGNFNYNGPCPAKGKTDHVIFHLYALDKTLLPLNSTASVKDFQKAITGHTLAKASLQASYTAKK